MGVGGKCSDTFPLFAGVPQGSILGPLTFLIFINDMFKRLDLECHRYADDITFVIRSDNIIQTVIKIDTELQRHWASQWCITFNALKTVFMVIANTYPPTKC